MSGEDWASTWTCGYCQGKGHSIGNCPKYNNAVRRGRVGYRAEEDRMWGNYTSSLEEYKRKKGLFHMLFGKKPQRPAGRPPRRWSRIIRRIR